MKADVKSYCTDWQPESESVHVRMFKLQFLLPLAKIVI
jgi:hypothetical protein